VTLQWDEELPVGSVVLDEDGVAWQRADEGWYSASPIRMSTAASWRSVKYGGVSVLLVGAE
jgi:hypothetical protein